MEKQLYFTDLQYEEKTKADLQATQAALQKLLDTWNSLDICECDDLFKLVTQPEKYHGQKVRETVEVPQSFGKFQIAKDAFIDLLDVPVPDSLYRCARDCRKMPFIGIPSLWSVRDGVSIVMDEDEAAKLITAHSITIENAEQKKFVEAVKAYQEASNYLHDVISGSSGKRIEYLVPFSITGKALPIISQVQIEPDVLRQVLKLL